MVSGFDCLGGTVAVVSVVGTAEPASVAAVVVVGTSIVGIVAESSGQGLFGLGTDWSEDGIGVEKEVGRWLYSLEFS